MKKYFLFSGVFIFGGKVDAQTVIPQTIPCITVTQSNITSLGSGISAVDCIETDGNLTFLQYENYSIKAGEYISFGQNTTIDPDATHQFHAYIDNSGMDIAWYYPNSTPGTVGIFEKLELGVEFENEIDQLVQNFTATAQTSPNLNPFNPEEVDLYAEFWWYNDGTVYSGLPVGWYGPFKHNGFYFEDYERGATDWTLIATEHDFRIRFAPQLLGLWRCKITANIAGYGTFTSTEFTFNSIDTGEKGFMQVGHNNNYFKIGDEPFFPVGHNISWPRETGSPNPRSADDICPPSYFLEYHQQIAEIKNNGGNYFRLINSPWSTDIEFEKLNDYSDRMIHAWEMDEILRVAEMNELLIHFNMQIHFNFEVPDGFGYFRWDWSATDDPWNDGSTCVAANDPGYCYRADLGIIDPVNFFTDATAIENYQYKLRYLIARYGYSNEIGLFELMSEVNNAGAKREMAFAIVNGKPGCYPVDGTAVVPYETTDLPQHIFTWQNEMCRYIKEDLQHMYHPLAVNYAGEPDAEDLSYQSAFVDVITYNNYGKSIEKWSSTKNAVDEYNYVGKPIMFSEYGPGADNTYLCDQGSDFIKTLILTPFTGTAGAAMNWEWQYPGEEQYWHHMGPVSELMNGLPLDEDNWNAWTPIVSSNKAVEILYLRNEGTTNNHKAVGAVSNRTYNFYTMATVSPCNILTPELQLPENLIYHNDANYEGNVNGELLYLPFMGYEESYNINWYNAMTGEQLPSAIATSDPSGNLLLDFPLITGNEVRPIVYFEIFPLNQSTIKSSPSDSTNSTTIYLERDSIAKVDLITNWSDSINENNVLVYPNPSEQLIYITILSQGGSEVQCQIMNTQNQVVMENSFFGSRGQLDLSTLSIGIYIIKVQYQSKIYEYKIVKI
ncbi:MAG: T9SS type A sorting domain-containing protein [Crocinitomicaceae bacterium]|nr:T9SS type A sorting domain-containing protein [Crocinitomicaceae bacterium]